MASFSIGAAPPVAHRSSSIVAGIGQGPAPSAHRPSPGQAISLKRTAQPTSSPATGPALSRDQVNSPSSAVAGGVDSAIIPVPAADVANPQAPARAEVPDTTSGFGADAVGVVEDSSVRDHERARLAYPGRCRRQHLGKLGHRHPGRLLPGGDGRSANSGTKYESSRGDPRRRLLGSTTVVKYGSLPGPAVFRGVVATKLEQGRSIFAIASGSQVADAQDLGRSHASIEPGKRERRPGRRRCSRGDRGPCTSLLTDAALNSGLGSNWERSSLVAVPALADRAPFVTLSAPGLTLSSVHVLEGPDPATRRRFRSASSASRSTAWRRAAPPRCG